MFVAGVATGLCLPWLFRVVRVIIDARNHNNIDIHRERLQMMVKDGHR